MGIYLESLEKIKKANVKKRGLTITVSGLAASGKDTIAKEIARCFNLKFVNAGDILRRFAKEKKVSLARASGILPAKIDYFTDEQMLKIAMRGNCVIASRLAAWVAGDFADCKIFINCRKSIRIKRLALRNNLTLIQARKMVGQRDNGDQRRYRRLYGVNLRQRKIYDLIIDNNRRGIEILKKRTIQMLRKFLKNKSRMPKAKL